MDEEMTLTPEAAAKFVEMIEHPPEPTEKLREAFERHGEAIRAESILTWMFQDYLLGPSVGNIVLERPNLHGIGPAEPLPGWERA